MYCAGFTGWLRHRACLAWTAAALWGCALAGSAHAGTEVEVESQVRGHSRGGGGVEQQAFVRRGTLGGGGGCLLTCPVQLLHGPIEGVIRLLQEYQGRFCISKGLFRDMSCKHTNLPSNAAMQKQGPEWPLQIGHG
jgi:hypothetical protein